MDKIEKDRSWAFKVHDDVIGLENCIPESVRLNLCKSIQMRDTIGRYVFIDEYSLRCFFNQIKRIYTSNVH